MANIRLLYFDSERLIIYQATEDSIKEVGVFRPDTQGLSAFVKEIERHKRDTYYLVADLAEESYHADLIPFVKGKARQELVARRIEKAFPNTDYHLSLSIGFEKINRLDEKLLIVGITNRQIPDFWLKVLQENNILIAGLYSISLLVPMLLNAIGNEATWTIVVSFSPAGMRLTLCENNGLRFSRLICPPSFDPIDLAEFCAAETTKTIQYLLTVRILPKNLPQITVLVIISEIDMAIFERALTPTLSLNPQFISIETCAVLTELKTYPQNGLSDGIFCHLLAKEPPDIQFAPAITLQQFRLSRLKKWLFFTTATILLFCLLLTGYHMMEGFNLYQDIHSLETENEQKSHALQKQGNMLFGQSIDPQFYPDMANRYIMILDRKNLDASQWFSKIDRLNSNRPILHFTRIGWTIHPIDLSAPKQKDALFKVQLSFEGWINLDPSTVPIHQRFSYGLNRIQIFAQELEREFNGKVTIKELPIDLSPEKALTLDHATFEQTRYHFALDCHFSLPSSIQ